MKQTRKVFVLFGDEQKVRNVLGVLNHYEAIVALFDECTSIEHVISCNKNAAVMSSVVPEEDLESGIIPIFVGTSFDENNVIDKESEEEIRQKFEEITGNYHIDIGDYIPDGEIKQPTKEGCILCKIYEGRNNPDKKPMDRVIYESENFYVCPAKGALVEGYVMICPKEHILSCAALPEEQKKELLCVINDVSYILKEVYGNQIFIFEHGSGEEGKCKHEKSIVHAHLHVLPTDMKITDEQRKMISMKPVTYDKLYQYDKVPYFWYIDTMDNMFITADPEVYIPRQYARQILAHNLGISGELWNWRKNDFKPKIDNTLMDIAEYLKKNNFRLPAQIRKRTESFLAEMTARNDVL